MNPTDSIPAPSQRDEPAVAYLVNQYPKVSHSFIRREIAALEALGRPVRRFSVRRADVLVDEDDRKEAQRTTVLLERPVTLLASLLRCAIGSPMRFASATRQAVSMGRRSPRGVMVHLVYLAEACKLSVLMRRDHITHVHAHFGTNPSTVARLCARVSGMTYSFTVHGPEEFDAPEALSLREKIGDATFVAAVSSFGRSQLWRWCDASHWPKVQIVRCGLDDAFLAPQLNRSQSATTQDTVGNTLVCVGRLCEQKGQLLLIDAAAMLADRGIGFQLVLVGDGEMRPQIERRIAQHGLKDRVTITGWQSAEQVRERLRAARGLVLPSFAEGLPVVIMESLAMGRPVVSTFIAGIPELVGPGCGWLVPAGDVAALSDALCELLQADPATLEDMGNLGASRVRLRHNAASEASRLNELFAFDAHDVQLAVTL